MVHPARRAPRAHARRHWREPDRALPFGAGGPADVYARFIGQHLSEALKQPFVIENRPGAGAVIGTDEVAKAAPDGYTLLMMSNTHTTNETLIPNKPYQLMRDFVPVAPINYSDLLMVVHPSVPAKDLKEFIALAKSKPGALNYASSGPGTPYHMAGELFKAMSGTDIVHVPHKGSGRGAQQRHRRPRADDDRRHHDHGAERAGGPGQGARHHRQASAPTVLPDVPTVAEAGVPGYEATIWLGIMAPTGTPQADRRQAQRRDQQGLDRADVQRGLGQAGRRADAHDAGRVRQLPARRHRQVGQGGQGRRHQGAVSVSR